MQTSRESMATATPPPLPSGSTLPVELNHEQVAYNRLMEAFDAEKPDALAAYTGLSATNPATEFLAGQVISINYNNAMAGDDMNPDVTAKATECFNKALAGDLDAGLEFLQVKHRGQSATQEIVKELGRSIGKETKGISERNAEILKRKATDFLQGKASVTRFRAEISRLSCSMGQKM